MSDIKLSIAAEINKSSIENIRNQLKTLEDNVKIKISMDDNFAKEMEKKFKDSKGTIEKDKIKISGDTEAFNKDLATATKQLQTMYSEAKVSQVAMKDMGDGMKEVTAQVKDANGQVTTIKHNFDSSTQSINKQIEGISGVNKGLQESGNLSKTQLDTQIKIQAQEKKIAKLKDETRKMNPNSDEYKQVVGELEKAEQTTKEFKKSLEKVNDADLQRLKANINNTEASLKRVVDVEKAHEQAIKEDLRRDRERERVLMEEQKIRKKIADESKVSLKEIGSDMESAGRGLLRLTAPLLAVGVASGKMAMDFESSFAGVRKTVDASELEFQKMSDGIRQLAKEMPTSASEIAKVAETAGQLGVENDSILSFSKTMVMLGDSTNMSADEAATALARLANITQMSHSNFDRLGSSVTLLGNNLATTEKEIVDMSLRLAGAASQAGMSEAQILAISGALSSLGVKAEAGGSSFSRLISNMQSSVETGKGSLEDFAKVSGMTAKQFQKAFKEDAAGALVAFIQGLGESEKQGKSAIKVLDDMGIKEIRIRDSLLRAAGGSDIFTESLKLGTKAWSENTALVNEAQERYKTMESQLKIAKNKIVDVAIEIGGTLAPHVIKIVDGVANLVEMLGKLPSGIQTAIVGIGLLGAGVGGFLSISGNLIRSLDSVMTLTEKLPKLFGKTGTAVEGAGALIGGFSSSSLLLIGGVTAAIAVAGTLAYKHFQKVKEQKEEMKKFVQDFDEIQKNNKDSVKWLDSVTGEYDKLTRKMGESRDITKLSADEQKRYNEIAERLIEISPSLKSHYDGNGNLIIEERDAVRELNKEKEREIELNNLLLRNSLREMGKDKDKQAEKRRVNLATVDEKIRKLELESMGKREKWDWKSKSFIEVDIEVSPERLREIEKELDKFTSERREITLGVKQDIAEMMPAISGSLGLLTDEFPAFESAAKGFASSIEQIMVDNPEKMGEMSTNAVSAIEKVIPSLGEMIASSKKINDISIQDFVIDLGKVGFTTEDATKYLSGMVIEAKNGEGSFEALTKAMEEYNSTGKISEKTGENLVNIFDGFEKGVDKIDLAFIKTLANQNKFAATFLASQTDFTSKAISQMEEFSEKEFEGFKIKKGEEFEKALNRQVKSARKKKEKLIKEVEEQADKEIEIIEYLRDTEKAISSEQADAIIAEKRRQKEESIKEIEALEIETVNRYMNIGKKLAEMPDDAFKSVDALKKSLNEMMENLDDKEIKMLLQVLGIDDVEKIDEKVLELIKKLQKDLDPLEFEVTETGLDDTTKKIEIAEKSWKDLDPKEKEFIAKELGLEDVKDLDEILYMQWILNQPDDKLFRARHEGLTETEYIAELVTKRWEELTPSDKAYIAYYMDKDNIQAVDRATYEQFVELQADPKFYEIVGKGFGTVKRSILEVDNVWGNLKSGTKTLTIKKNTIETKAYSMLQNMGRKWTGDDNFKGGLSWVKICSVVW